MSGFMFLDNSGKKDSGRHRSAVAFVVAMLLAGSSLQVAAGPLDWFKGNAKSKKVDEARVVLTQKNPDEALFSGNEGASSLSGQNLDSMAFAKTHWSHAKNQFEKVCKAIIQRSNNRDNADLITKIFVIDTQIFKEAIKNSAQAVNELSATNESMRQQLSDLSRIITAPGQETLDSLEKSVAKLKATGQRQHLSVKKYLIGSERIIEIGNQAYETLELIPSLAVTGTDMTISSSKQMMKITQSNAEAFKGLMLNVQSSYEQTISGLDTITRTVRETLRFSDHFAIRQFPLINLPAPSREKIYVQLNSLNNSLKNVNNTLSIGDSQVRNTSQQFTHLISALSSKVGEALKFAGSGDSPDKALEQISNYAQNQVAGLFQRVKEDVRRMRSDMLAVVKNGGSQVAPEINIESGQEFAVRRTREASKEKLPLFLLGGGRKSEMAKAVTNSQTVARPVQNSAANAAMEVTRVLYTENPSAQESGLMGSELDILRDELGSNFFFAGEELAENKTGSNEDFNDDDEFADEDAGYPASDHDEMQISQENLSNIEEPEIELLKFDMTGSSGESSELLPMMRLDDALMFEE